MPKLTPNRRRTTTTTTTTLEATDTTQSQPHPSYCNSLDADGHLPREIDDYHRDNNLCTFCGKPGQYTSMCPSLAQRNNKNQMCSAMKVTASMSAKAAKAVVKEISEEGN